MTVLLLIIWYLWNRTINSHLRTSPEDRACLSFRDLYYDPDAHSIPTDRATEDATLKRRADRGSRSRLLYLLDFLRFLERSPFADMFLFGSDPIVGRLNNLYYFTLTVLAYVHQHHNLHYVFLPLNGLLIQYSRQDSNLQPLG